MNNRKDLKAFISRVDKLLWEEWDPIGCGVPADEYTSYANVVAGKAINGETSQQILDYLYWAENENMGLHLTREEARLRNEPIAAKILLWAKAVKKTAP